MPTWHFQFHFLRNVVSDASIPVYVPLESRKAGVFRVHFPTKTRNYIFCRKCTRQKASWGLLSLPVLGQFSFANLGGEMLFLISYTEQESLSSLWERKVYEHFYKPITGTLPCNPTAWQGQKSWLLVASPSLPPSPHSCMRSFLLWWHQRWKKCGRLSWQKKGHQDRFLEQITQPATWRVWRGWGKLS